MNRLFLTTIGVLCFATLNAQTTKEEMLANPSLMNSNGLVYQTNFKPQTPAPKGYKPFYISHYGRHGSRYHYTGFDYMTLRNTMVSADEANALTPTGKDLKDRICKLYDDGYNRAGDLTRTGFMQHQGIAERMVNSFPEIFADGAKIDVKSSTSHRVIMSMDAFLQKLNALRPNLNIYTESSKRLMSYINNEKKDSLNVYLRGAEWNKVNSEFGQQIIQPERFVNTIFADTAYAKSKVNGFQLMRKLYEINSTMQGIDDLDFDFSDFFTQEELFNNWQLQNVYWYSNYSTCPYTKSHGAKLAKALLTNFLDEADKAIAGNGTSATLRFGHDTGLLPLASLMELEGCNAEVTDLAELYKVWCDYKIIPMAGNLQMIFYKSDKTNDILVKVLLNENEVKLPIESKTAPYYNWSEVEAYYRDIIAKM